MQFKLFYVAGVKRLIGHRFGDANVQEDIKHWPFKVVNGAGDRPRIEVEYKYDQLIFSPEEILAIILTKLKRMGESHLGQAAITDAVITVPAHFNRSQRQSIKDAGTIAGLNVIRVISASTATAITYGQFN